ncbi:MAG: SCO family protein [Phycisphaeraceae bacterium]|nr:SCO family protein [Phycisphaeraceae bacterium]
MSKQPQSLKPFYVALAALSLVTVILLLLYQTQQKKQAQLPTQDQNTLEPLLQLPHFELNNAQGNRFDSKQLQGKVWIADFVFTRCMGPCPMLTLQMAKLELQLKNDPRWQQMRLVTFTVDPDYDTPKVLSEHSKRAGISTQQWLWLTGDRKPMWDLINNGFKLMVGPSDTTKNDPGHGLITHSSKFVLIDRKLQTRGYYDALKSDDIKRLLDDLQIVLNEK